MQRLYTVIDKMSKLTAKFRLLRHLTNDHYGVG